ncbi:MAG: S-adenosyl-L-methionine-dependent methyltransferase [Benniella sp.]|nr:MAG: S-adenosyl-L-methionine-dependent methyltransferase [Benniella sp.]
MAPSELIAGAQSRTRLLICDLTSNPECLFFDVGCGPGSISVDMAKLVPKGRVVGIEYTSDPLNEARAFATQQGVTNTEFQHVADPIQALREMRRIAKPGGIVAVRESAELSLYLKSLGLEAYWNLASTMARLKGGNLHPGKKIHTSAREAGFERSNITCSAGAWCFSSPEQREYWGGSMQERTLSSAFATNAVEMNLASQEELKDIAEAWRDWIKNDDGWFSLLHGEIICRKE